MTLMHKIIFWSHLLAGVIAGVVIFIMSVTGVILMYEHQLVEYAGRDVRDVVPPGGAARLSLDEIVARARAQTPEARPTGLILRNQPTASVAVGLGGEGTVYVNPYSGAVLGRDSKLHDWFRDVIGWHRWLGMEGAGRDTGRAITGACNLAFLWLAVTGIYLWWPRTWDWRGLKTSLLFNPRLSGKARDWNWHNVIGFWSSSVLVVLTVSAAVMSYPWANDLLYTLTGSEQPSRSQGSTPADQATRRNVREEPQTRTPGASFDVLLARAQQQMPEWATIMIRLPARADAPVVVSMQEAQPPHPFARSQLTLDRATGAVVGWEPYSGSSPGRKLRTYLRGLHTGEALGFIGQTIAGLASLGGCFLVWTGFAMACRRFRYRKRGAEDATATTYVPRPAEILPAARVNPLQSNETSKTLARIEMELGNFNQTNGRAHNGHEGARAEWMTRYNADSVLILYGTVTGNAESLAHRLAASLQREGFTPQVRDMAQCHPNVLTESNWILMVVSTYGDGDPPDGAIPFWQAVVHGNGLDLRGVRYSVLGLGNTTFDHFCKCGREFDAALERHGAMRIYPRVDCDVDYDTPAKHWLQGVLAQLTDNEPSTLSA